VANFSCQRRPVELKNCPFGPTLELRPDLPATSDGRRLSRSPALFIAEDRLNDERHAGNDTISLPVASNAPVSERAHSRDTVQVHAALVIRCPGGMRCHTRPCRPASRGVNCSNSLNYTGGDCGTFGSRLTEFAASHKRVTKRAKTRFCA
jgi:hypothetical protein